MTFTATRSALNHKPDPSLELDPLGIGLDRDWASYATARLVVTPNSGDVLTVPLYASPRVASTMHAAAAPTLSGSGTTAAGTLTLAGTGVHQGAVRPAQDSRGLRLRAAGHQPQAPRLRQRGLDLAPHRLHPLRGHPLGGPQVRRGVLGRSGRQGRWRRPVRRPDRRTQRRRTSTSGSRRTPPGARLPVSRSTTSSSTPTVTSSRTWSSTTTGSRRRPATRWTSSWRRRSASGTVTTSRSSTRSCSTRRRASSTPARSAATPWSCPSS